MNEKLKNDAIEYHAKPVPGKVSVVPSKKCDTERELSLAYSPGVAIPCLEIAKNEEKVYELTTKGNLVAVISNGSAVLGLGNIGPSAAKPVMEGKGVLFKQFANINVFDLELKAETPDQFIEAVKTLEPTFGGINLEDIKAPECFYIEERLKKEMNIPVFHDDQHGTAIITGAAFINACRLAKKELAAVRVVFNGAGAAAVACARLFIKLGVQPQNLIMCDSKGVIYKGRKESINEIKAEFAIETPARTLADALKNADAFCGLSVAGAVTQNMVKSMATDAIIFAMANPEPEITPEKAKEVRKDIIMATGRTDYPNQVNNVLGFPSIFRGALDVHATAINEEMKMAAVYALADLACEEVPESVSSAYGGQRFQFSSEYIIPKPFDPRVLTQVAPAVAKAAMESGVAKKPIENFASYREKLEGYQGFRRSFVRRVINQVKAINKKKGRKPRILFPEGTSVKILRALSTLKEEDFIEPVLIGYPNAIEQKAKELNVDISGIEIIYSKEHPKFNDYVQTLYEMRRRRGVMLAEAERLVSDPYYFATMAVETGDADSMILGSNQKYKNCVKPILEVIRSSNESAVIAGLNIVLINEKMLFFADTTINVDPNSEQLATIAIEAADVARLFKIEPKIAMLSYTNFSGFKGSPRKMKEASKLVKKMRPDLECDGEMQADTAVNPEIVERIFPFCKIKGGANVLIFPNLDASNIGYKLVQQLGGGEVLGPFLMGIRKPCTVLQRTSRVEDIVNSAALTALDVLTFKGDATL